MRSQKSGEAAHDEQKMAHDGDHCDSTGWVCGADLSEAELRAVAAFWVSNIQTLPTDVFKAGEIGTAMDFSGMGGAVGGILANPGTGNVVQNFSFAPVFLMAGLMHPLPRLSCIACCPTGFSAG